MANLLASPAEGHHPALLPISFVKQSPYCGGRQPNMMALHSQIDIWFTSTGEADDNCVSVHRELRRLRNPAHISPLPFSRMWDSGMGHSAKALVKRHTVTATFMNAQQGQAA